MKKVAALAASLTLLLGAGWLHAEDRASPHEQVSASLGGKKVTITYGRPYKKGRDIFGGLVPWQQVWRLGADEATALDTETDLIIGGVAVPKGSYTLYAIPSEKEWTLVINKKVKTWGAYEYDQKLDVGRAKMAVTAPPALVEQLTISIETKGDKSGTLKAVWDKTVASVPIAAK